MVAKQLTTIRVICAFSHIFWPRKGNRIIMEFCIEEGFQRNRRANIGEYEFAVFYCDSGA